MYSLSDFDYSLPTELIAQRPFVPKDSSRLLHVAQDNLNDHVMRDLPSFLRAGDLLLVNDTKVIPAQLYGRINEKNIGLTLHKQISEDSWLAFAKPAKKCILNSVIDFGDGFEAIVDERRSAGEALIRFNYSSNSLTQKIEKYGKMPLPPYIKRGREGDNSDVVNYQTLFAKKTGAVAAPTAGLHFTPELKQSVLDAGAQIEMVTLHVGAGTYLPVKSENLSEHKMHSEWGEVTSEIANKINETKHNNGRIICVGTTSLRIVESIWAEFGIMEPFKGYTDLFITPGYTFNVADILLTNFHLPKSTLLMLVSAFAGFYETQAAYRHAIDHRYRFFSYGDACLLEKKK